jgi:hypothetical protein
MARKKRTEEELRIASNHLHYEYWMLATTAREMAIVNHDPGVVNNAILESFVIHVRNMIYFLYSERPKNDHIVAGDFFESPSDWEEIRPVKSENLKNDEIKAHKGVAHLSYDRATQDKSWHFVELANEISTIFQIFVKHVQLDLLGDRWMLNKLQWFEGDIQYDEPASKGEAEFQYVEGTIPLLISAPHGAKHWRKSLDDYKQEDEYTGGLAQLLGEQTGAHVIYVRRKIDYDPNEDKEIPYKDKVKEICDNNEIKLILDLHGAGIKNEFGVELGTMKGESCEKYLPKIKEIFNKYDFTEKNEPNITRLWIDKKFTGSGSNDKQRIIGFVWEELNIPAIQIEINGHLRIVDRKEDAHIKEKFSGNPALIEKIVKVLKEIIDNVSK